MNKEENFISIIMATHRVDIYLAPAIKSIIDQTHKNFEFIIIANGVNCNEIENFINENFHDERIIIIKSKIPQLAHSLNIGLNASKADLVARMDADDISHPDRIKKQVAYIEKHNLDILGCDINLIDINNKLLGKREYPKGKKIEKLIYFKNPFAHNTIIYKKDKIILLRGYNSGLNTEDYDLWLRAKRSNLKMDNMSEVLLDYRLHSNSTQGNKLGYAEASGYMLREFLLEMKIIKFISILISITKFFMRGK